MASPPPSQSPVITHLTSLRLMLDEATAELQRWSGRKQELEVARVVADFLQPLKLVLREKAKLLSWEEVCSNRADKAVALLILAEHRLVITSVASMLSKAVELLNSIVDTAPFNQPFFKALLALIFYSLELFSITPVCWPCEAYLLGNIPLYAALDSLVNCHLKISRRPATIRQPSLLPLLNSTCPNMLISILKATFQCVMKLAEQPASAVCAVSCALPVGFLPRLCCQVCEAYAADLVPPHPPRRDICPWATLQLLIWTVWRCLTASNTTSESRAAMARSLLGPAVVVAAKMSVAAFAITDPAQRPRSINLSLLSDGIVALASFHTAFIPWCGNFNASGGGSTAAPTPRVKFDDALLVRAVRLISLDNPQLMEKCTSLMNVLLVGLIVTIPPKALHACLAGMVHHCSQQVKLRLQAQKRRPRKSCWYVQTTTIAPGQKLDPIMLELRSLLFGCVSVAARHAAASRTGLIQPAYSMTVWAASKGGVRVLEALLREEHRPKSADDHRNAAAAIINMMSGASQSPDALPACLSLAGTCHKLTLELMQVIATCRSMGRETMVAEVERMEAFVQQHLIMMLSCLRWSEDTAKAIQDKATGVAAGDSNSSHSSCSSSNHSSCSADSVSSMRKRLRAMVMLSLLQFEGFLVQVSKRKPAASRPQWLRELEECDAELAGIVWQQLSTQQSPMAVRLVGQAAWEAYTLAHFNGRLMPGCGFVRCTNLAGSSEAGLQTWLCAGCKRVRYCSMECQRTARVAGGHGLVCGKGAWAC